MVKERDRRHRRRNRDGRYLKGGREDTWEDVAGDVAGKAFLGGVALCQRRYFRGIVAMCDPH